MKTLHVFKKIITRSAGYGSEAQECTLTKCWQGEFKTDADLLAAVIDYTQLGMYCQIEG